MQTGLEHWNCTISQWELATHLCAHCHIMSFDFHKNKLVFKVSQSERVGVKGARF